MLSSANGPTPRERIERGVHIGGMSSCALVSDEYTAMLPPTDGCLARCGKDSVEDFNPPTTPELASRTLQ